MAHDSIEHLVTHLRAGSISRRAFMRKATAAGMSTAAAMMIARNTLAQDATPAGSPAASPVASPAASGPVTKSLTREEYIQQIKEHFPFEESAGPGGQMIFPTTVDMATLNPHIRSDVVALYIIAPIFSNLISSAPWDASIYGPDLADYWEESADGVTYTFYLNQNARFHDGTPVTAHDVVFSYDAMISPDSLSTYQSDFSANVKSYRAIDDYTFELVAKQRSALFLSAACAGLCVLPRHIWEPIPYLEWGSAPGATGADPSQVIGSGPFRFQEWVKNDHATIVRNDDYYVPEMVPQLDSFTLRVVPESTAAIQTFVTGETDLLSIPPAQVESVISQVPDATLHQFDTWRHQFLSPNLQSGTLFNDVNVRKALYHALDRDSIVADLLLGYAVRADGPQPPPSPAYAPDRITTIYQYDPELAKSLVEGAGWVDTDGDGVREKDGVRFECDVYYVSSAQNDQLLAYFQQSFGEIGLRVNPVAEPQPTFLERLTGSGDFELAFLGVTWINQGDQGAIHSCAGFPPNGFNIPRWCNEEYDALQAQQLVELDPAKRFELLVEMSNIFNEDAPEILLCFDKAVAATQARLKNAFPNGLGLTWSLPWTWVDQNA